MTTRTRLVTGFINKHLARLSVIAISLIACATIASCATSDGSDDTDESAALPENQTGAVAATTAARQKKVQNCFKSLLAGSTFVEQPAFVGLEFTNNFWRAQIAVPGKLVQLGNDPFEESYIDDTKVCQLKTFSINVFAAKEKWVQGQCACSDGSVATCPVSPPSSDHKVCNAAVTCACKKCRQKTGKPGSARGCQVAGKKVKNGVEDPFDLDATEPAADEPAADEATAEPAIQP